MGTVSRASLGQVGAKIMLHYEVVKQISQRRSIWYSLSLRRTFSSSLSSSCSYPRKEWLDDNYRFILFQHSNPAENDDLRLFERTVDVLRDSAIGLHREYFTYDETVDADDILAQLDGILNEISESLLTSHDYVRIDDIVTNIERRVGEMKMKMAQGLYGQGALCAGNSASNTAPENRMYLISFQNMHNLCEAPMLQLPCYASFVMRQAYKPTIPTADIGKI
ncbi:hypothetical protein Y032_0610g622 [Ancylostoma ceylanicum]|uniref:Uncharacterized protein n=1 Tax=Ancylostoma ceylanicum TaxID=53326 RepID=A0A016WLM2_9BILA|nr:hypothetical protein Y032_0610g622 [Ancylostoma ceylanicum]